MQAPAHMHAAELKVSRWLGVAGRRRERVECLDALRAGRQLWEA